MTTETEKRTDPRSCRDCERWPEVRQSIRISELLEKAISTLQARLEAADYKPTVGDFLKLLQIEKDIDEEAPKEIKVTWVDPAIPSDSAK